MVDRLSRTQAKEATSKGRDAIKGRTMDHQIMVLMFG